MKIIFSQLYVDLIWLFFEYMEDSDDDTNGRHFVDDNFNTFTECNLQLANVKELN